MSLRSATHQIHAIWRGARHYRREPTVRGREIRGHEVVVVQIATVVIADGALTDHVVDESEIPPVVSRCPDEPVHGRIESAGGRIVVVHVNMRLVPGGTGVLQTHCLQVVGRKWVSSVKLAVIGRGKSGIATRIARCKTRGGSKLRETIERLVLIPILGPVLAKRSEVVVKGAVLLRHEDNMVDRLDSLSRVENRANRLVGVQGELARSRAGTGACPARKSGAGICHRGQLHHRSNAKTCCAGRPAIYPVWAAADNTDSRTGLNHREGYFAEVKASRDRFDRFHINLA